MNSFGSASATIIILCWVRTGGAATRVSAWSPESGVRMDCYTDLPGVQFYTANVLGEPGGKGGRPLRKNQGFCLETQFFPDSPNQPSFPSPVLRAGRTV